jgi:hypothetical protein
MELIKELIDSGAAGMSRRTAIHTQSDPDGPLHHCRSDGG